MTEKVACLKRQLKICSSTSPLIHQQLKQAWDGSQTSCSSSLRSRFFPPCNRAGLQVSFLNLPPLCLMLQVITCPPVLVTHRHSFLLLAFLTTTVNRGFRNTRNLDFRWGKVNTRFDEFRQERFLQYVRHCAAVHFRNNKYSDPSL